MNRNSIIVTRRVSRFALQKNLFFLSGRKTEWLSSHNCHQAGNRRRVKGGSAEPFISTLDAAAVFRYLKPLIYK